MTTRKEVLTAASKMDLKDVDKETTFTLMGDATDVYVFPNAPMAPPRTAYEMVRPALK